MSRSDVRNPPFLVVESPVARVTAHGAFSVTDESSTIEFLMRQARDFERRFHRTAMVALVHPKFRKGIRLEMHRNSPLGCDPLPGPYLGRVLVNGIEVVEAERIPFKEIRFA